MKKSAQHLIAEVSHRQLREENARLKKLVAEFGASERHTCELMEIGRTTHRYQSQRDDNQLREQLLRLAREKPRFGYRRPHILLEREGAAVNHKRVQRVYRELGLM
jgi:putative transposase